MRYKYDLGLRFHGPERLCAWCAELATSCSCKGGLSRQVAAECMGCLELPKAFNVPEAPRPVRKDVVLAAVLPRAEPHYGPFLSHAQRLLRRQFWCPHCERMRPIHGCAPKDSR